MRGRPSEDSGFDLGVALEWPGAMTELLEHADRDLAEALATYRALLRFPEQGAAQLTRADVLAGAARELSLIHI